MQITFYALLVYFATSMGTKTVAAHQVWFLKVYDIEIYILCLHFCEDLMEVDPHQFPNRQVMIQLYCICAVWGEPLSQTAQSFMPELIYGANRSLAKVCCL